MSATRPSGEADGQLSFEPDAPFAAVPIGSPSDSAGSVRQNLMGRRFDCASHLAVRERGRLVGLVRIEDLLAAQPHVPLSMLMDADPPTIGADDDEEVAAWKAVRHGESALAITTADGDVAGIVAPRRMVEVLLAEHDEDLARLGGYLTSTASARHAIEEPVHQRLVHRLPWLLVGLVGAIVAALVVERAEAQLEAHVLLAFFVPGIVYMADAVGTQTEALVIRGLSVGVPIARILVREVITGLVIGVALASAFVPIGVVLWDDGDVVITVAVALFAACATATAVAMALPWTLHRLGRDPAYGSGPLATVIQDLLSLLIYFAVASAIVG